MTLTIEQAHEAYRGMSCVEQSEIQVIMGEPGIIPGDQWDFLFRSTVTKMLRAHQLRVTAGVLSI